jgi:hypothetical protein
VRLREEVVAAGLDALHAVGGVVERRDEDDGRARGARVALEAPAHLEAGQAVGDAEVPGGHAHVEQADVGSRRERQGERAGPVLREDGAEAEQLQLVREELDVGGHVVGDQHERRLAAVPPGPRPRAERRPAGGRHVRVAR